MARGYEHEIQVSIVEYLRLRRYLVAAIPNGGSRHPAEAVRLKREGVLAGVADLVIILPDAKLVWVEVKTPTGHQSESQVKFQKMCEEKGHTYLIWRSIDDGIRWHESQEKSHSFYSGQKTIRLPDVPGHVEATAAADRKALQGGESN